jgi:hypothetical protein
MVSDQRNLGDGLPAAAGAVIDLGQMTIDFHRAYASSR